MTKSWPDPKPVSELLEPGNHGGIFLVGWYDSPQIARASLSVYLEPLADGTTHEWSALLPDPDNLPNGIAKRITPDVYWPCPTAVVWPRRAVTVS